jgi:hypothetical protein
MRVFFSVIPVLALIAIIAGLSCDSDGGYGGLCGSYCDGVLSVADDMDCDLDSSAKQECYTTCQDALADLDEDERSEAEDCLECLEEEAGTSPDLDDWFEALNDECRSDCSESGMIEFLEESEDIEEFFEDCDSNDTSDTDDTSTFGCPPEYVDACTAELFDCATLCEGDTICVQVCCYDACYCFQIGGCDGVEDCYSSCENLP